ncbi:unnamed protein product [Urochloa humidicola]
MEKRSGDNRSRRRRRGPPCSVDLPLLPRRSRSRSRGTTPPSRPRRSPRPSTSTLLSPDPLECPPCFAPFEAEIFQCKNGHAACGNCCDRVRGTCPSCGDPIGAIRCLPLEAAIAAMLVPCSFAGGRLRAPPPPLRRAARPRGVRLPTTRRARARSLAAPSRASTSTSTTTSATRTAIPSPPPPGTTRSGSSGRRRWRCAGARRSGCSILHAQDSRVFLLLNGGGVPSGRSLLAARPRPAPRRRRRRGRRHARVHHGGARRRRRALAVGVGARAVRAPVGGALPDGRVPLRARRVLELLLLLSSSTVSVTVHVGSEAGPGRGAGAGRRGTPHALLDGSCPTK